MGPLQPLKPSKTSWLVPTECDDVCWKFVGCGCGYDGHTSDCMRNCVTRLVLYSDERNARGAVRSHQSLKTFLRNEWRWQKRNAFNDRMCGEARSKSTRFCWNMLVWHSVLELKGCWRETLNQFSVVTHSPKSLSAYWSPVENNLFFLYFCQWCQCDIANLTTFACFGHSAEATWGLWEPCSGGLWISFELFEVLQCAPKSKHTSIIIIHILVCARFVTCQS